MPVRYRAMPLSEQQLRDDLTRAMKARDMRVVYVLRGVVAALKNLKVERRSDALEEADIVQVMRREIRQRQEAEDFARKAGRQDLIDENVAERGVLEPYLPAMLSDDELEARIRALVSESTSPSMGAVMGGLRAALAGRFDGRRASEFAKAVLAEHAEKS